MQLKAPTLELPLSTFTSQSLSVNAPAGFPQRNLERAFWLGSAGTTLMAFCCWPWTRIFPFYVIPENLRKISTPPVATVTHIWTVTSPRNPLFLAKTTLTCKLNFFVFHIIKNNPSTLDYWQRVKVTKPLCLFIPLKCRCIIKMGHNPQETFEKTTNKQQVMSHVLTLFILHNVL